MHVPRINETDPKGEIIMKPAIFLDRDGVINENLPDGVMKWEDFELLPNTLEAMKLLNDNLPKDIKILITTNQPYVNKGKLPKERLDGFHNKMKNVIEGAGGRIDKIYYCPHQDSDNCNCRKPKPGMHLQAAKDFNIDLKKSIYVGDSTKDIKLGNNLKETTILIETGRAGQDGNFEAVPDYVEKDLLAASKVILKIFSSRN